MPRFKKQYYRDRKGNRVFYRAISDFGRIYPTYDHWIDAVDEKQKWNKRRLKFSANFFRR